MGGVVCVGVEEGVVDVDCCPEHDWIDYAWSIALLKLETEGVTRPGRVRCL